MQGGGYAHAKRLTDIQPWFNFIVSFDIVGHTCYGQISPVKTRYSLTSITWPHLRLKFRVHQGHMFSFKLTANQMLFSIGSLSRARLTCCKQDQVVRKPVNANQR